MERSEGYSLKELVQELRADNKNALATQATILERLDNINDHLAKLNSKVASHEEKLASAATFETRVLTVWAIAVVIFSSVAQKVIANFGL